MSAFVEIFRFEFRYHLRSGLFILTSSLLALMAFGAVASDVVQIGGGVGRVNVNSPSVIGQILVVLSIIGVFVSTAFLAGAVLRDFDQRTNELFFSTPVKKRDYVFGRFFGAFAASVALFIPVAIGLFLGTVMPWQDPERIGPFMAGPYLFSFAVFIVPNLLLMGAVFFGLATVTRSMIWTYVGLVAFFLGWGVSTALLGNLEKERLAALLDPFGAVAIGVQTRYWTVAERNTQSPVLEGALLTNRLVWIAVAVVALLATYALFSMSTEKKRGKREAPKAQATEPVRPPPRMALPTPARTSYTRAGVWAQLRRQTRYEVMSVVRSAAFVIILAMGMLNLIGNAAGLDSFFGTPVHPRTYIIFDLVAGGFFFFLIIILAFYAGEIVFRDRQLRMDEVVDALPVPNGVLWASKLFALLVVVFSLLAASVMAGMGIQLYHGYTDFQLGLYLQGGILYPGLAFAAVAVLALFFQVVLNNKFMGYLVIVVYFVAGPVFNALHFEHNLYFYGSAPLLQYSDMNGFGHRLEPFLWFTLYWSLCAVLLLVGVHLLWARGKETAWRTRLALAHQRMNTPTLAVGVATLAAFVATGAWIFYNTNVLNEYVPGDVAEDRAARFETDYKQYEGIPQPKITDIRTEVDIFPEDRAVDIRGTYALANRSGQAIDALHVTVPLIVEITELEVPGATLETEDAEVGYYIYRFDQPLAAGAELRLAFDLAVRNRGFKNHGFNDRVVENGTFVNSGGFFPHIGYNRGGELQDPNERRKRGLPPVQRLPKLEDREAWDHHMLGQEADWVTYEAVVSTSPDQIALAPGYLQREWEEDGRRYFHYAMDAPILAYHSYLSARWAVKSEDWKGVEVSVYYDPAHHYNVDKMIEASKRGLDYFNENFGPYQHRQFRIIEFPRFASFAEAFPNTIPFSEAIGFIAKLDDPDEIDYVTYVTAHELAHQWWAHQVIGAGVQGATVTSETMAQYSALMLMKEQYGPELMRRFLKYELDAYLRGRGGELIEEMPLKLVEAQPYIHYRKGSLVRYAPHEAVGEATLNEALARYVQDVKFREPPYTTTLEFLDYVSEAIPEGQQSIVEDLFETITLYENRTDEATVTQRADGKYVVRLEAETRKYRADGTGAETEIAIDDWIDVGVFGPRGEGDPPEGKVLALERHRVTDADTVIELVVDEAPLRAGIDPFNKLVDRNPENNTVDVSDG
jgi:ABC-type transport system involved in multi-copper enzyme maturation permease subunit